MEIDVDTPMQLRNRLIESKKQYGRGEISVDELLAVADAYIAAIAAYKKATGKRFSIPNGGYLIRAI